MAPKTCSVAASAPDRSSSIKRKEPSVELSGNLCYLVKLYSVNRCLVWKEMCWLWSYIIIFFLILFAWPWINLDAIFVCLTLNFLEAILFAYTLASSKPVYIHSYSPPFWWWQPISSKFFWHHQKLVYIHSHSPYFLWLQPLSSKFFWHHQNLYTYIHIFMYFGMGVSLAIGGVWVALL